jgi:hypothetical protein
MIEYADEKERRTAIAQQRTCLFDISSLSLSFYFFFFSSSVITEDKRLKERGQNKRKE